MVFCTNIHLFRFKYLESFHNVSIFAPVMLKIKMKHITQ